MNHPRARHAGFTARVANLRFQVDFGGVAAIRSVDPSLPKQLDYFGSSVDQLLAAGLVLNSTVLGAPYDWRLEPSGDLRAGASSTATPTPYPLRPLEQDFRLIFLTCNPLSSAPSHPPTAELPYSQPTGASQQMACTLTSVVNFVDSQ